MSALVRDVMRRNVLSVSPDDSLALAVQTMLWTGFRHLPVVREGRLEGVLSERDVLRLQAARRDPDVGAERVQSAMTAPAHFIDPAEPLGVAAERMAAHKIGCLPVLERGSLVGILTTNDVLRVQLALPGEVREAGEPLGWSAADVMTPNPVTAGPDEYLVNALAKMSLAGVRHLPVVDEQGRVVGLLSDRDVRLFSEGGAEGAPRLRDPSLRVRAVMSKDVMTVKTGAGPAVLLTAFTDWRIGALPVVGPDGRLAGLVSYVDLLNHFSRTAAQHAA